MEREIIHVDVTAFAVAVERVAHPELRGRPVVVAPVGRTRSVVTALSQEAWESGIRKGVPLVKAIRYCREVVVLPPNEPLYARASRAIFKVLQEFSPVLEPAGYGHAFMDVTGTERLFGPARDTAHRAQQEIRRRLRLDTTLGIASNKMVSRIAAQIIKPVGLQDVPAGDEPSFLAPHRVSLLPGVGPEAEARLHELNIRIIRDLLVVELEHLMLAFGRLGFVLHQRARGIDNTPVFPARDIPAVEEEKTLAEDSNDLGLLRAMLFELCERAGERLRATRQRAGRMEIRVRYSDYREEAGRAKLAPADQSTAALCAAAGGLLERVLARRTRVRRLSLRLTELANGPAQMDLFADPAPARRASLDAALDRLRHRFGAKALEFRIQESEFRRSTWNRLA